MNVPDNLRGAYVLRNGLAPGVALWGKGRFTRLVLVSQNSGKSVADAVELTGDGDGFTVRLTNPATTFLRFTDPKSIAPVTASDTKRLTFRLSLGPLADDDKVLYYSAGHMHVRE